MALLRGFFAASLIAAAAACGGLVDSSDLGGGGGSDAATTPRGPHEPTDAGVSTDPSDSAYDEAGSAPPPPGSGYDASTTPVDAGTFDAGADVGSAVPDAGTVSPTTLATGNPLFLAIDGTRLYWTDGQVPCSVRSLEKATGAVTILSTSTAPLGQGPEGIAVDATSVYWTELGPDLDTPSGSIRSVPIGGGATTVLADGQGGPEGIAVDATSIYWTNLSGGTVMKANLDGSNARTIATGQYFPVSVKVTGGALVWTNSEWPNSNVVTSGLEGENPKVLYATSSLFDVATDGTTAFFLESIGADGYLRSVTISGGASALLAIGSGGFTRGPIALDANFIWMSWAGGEGLVKIPRAGGPQIMLLPQPFGDPPVAVDIVLDDTSIYWTEASGGTPSIIRTMPK